jgi:hypothetical protein
MNNTLTQAQAEAILSALAALNNVGARISGDIVGDNFAVRFNPHTGEIRVSGKRLTDRDYYDGQSEFAAAYGLN